MCNRGNYSVRQLIKHPAKLPSSRDMSLLIEIKQHLPQNFICSSVYEHH
jgi:hypothetical protein